MRSLLVCLVVFGMCLVVTSAFAQDEYTVLLLHCNGEDGSTNFIDSSDSGNDTAANGNAQIDTAEKRFGTGSLYLDGNSYLSMPDSDNWYFGSGDFTIDFWIKFELVSGPTGLCGQFLDEYHRWRIMFNSNDIVLYFYDNSANINVQCVWTPSVDVWYHIAVSRSSGVIYLFINGVNQPLSYNLNPGGTIDNVPADFNVGWDGQHVPVNGYIDEFRISKGVARWTADFDIPTGEYGTPGGDGEPPIADAGSDLFAYVGEKVTLDGRYSNDPDNDIVSWIWRSLSESENPVIAEGETAAINAHGYAEELIELTVTDSYGNKAIDTMKIINPGIEGPMGPAGPQGEPGPQGAQGPSGITPEEILAIQNKINELEQQNILQQNIIDQNRYLLKQLPQLKKKIEELEAAQSQ